MNGLKRIDNIFKREYILERKLNNYIYNHVEYDDATISEMREYAEKKNTRLKEKYEDDVSKGYHPEEPVYIDMTVFGAVG
jgi:hypothetical protein|nr:MAG TPA: hypothetical protein [Bacteriophage sp.]